MSVMFLRRAANAAAIVFLPAAGLAQPSALPPPAELTVSYTQTGLTVRADQVALETLLAAIGNRLGIAVVVPPPKGIRVTLNVDNKPVTEVIRLALKPRSYLLAYSQPWTGSLDESPNRLWILTNNSETRSGFGDFQSARPESPDSIEAAIAIAEGDESRLIEELAALLRFGTEETVREQAVFALGELGDHVPFTLFEQALQDPSPIVRETTIYALAELGGSRAMAAVEMATTDEDSDVSQAASEALEDSLW